MIYDVLLEGSKNDVIKKVSSEQELRPGTRIFIYDKKELKRGFVLREASGSASLLFCGVVDDLVSEDRLKVLKWISERYSNSLSTVLSLSYPPGLEEYMRVIIYPTSIFSGFEEMEMEEFVEKFGKVFFLKVLTNGTGRLKVNWKIPKVLVRNEETYVLAKNLSEILHLNLSVEELRVVQRFMERGTITFSELSKEFLKKNIFSLVKKGVIKRSDQVVKIDLREDQKRVVESAKKGVNILIGQTGSGKTEVYLEMMKNKKTLYLVPEVSLIPQLVRRIRERLGKVEVGVYHSYMTPQRRIHEWLKAVHGNVDVLVGTRSAVFVPFSWNLIVVDEFHDESFYQRENVVYDGVEVVKKMSEIFKIPVILGSATPRLEEYQNESIKKFHIKRIFPPPSVKLINLREVKRKGSFAVETLELMDKVLSRKKRVMIFVRRKGFGRVYCEDCGYVVRCKNCDVSLTHHISTKSFKCHICGYEVGAFDGCPICGGTLRSFGTGTERVEHELKRYFPEKVVERVDREILKRPDSIISVLDRFSRGEVDVLVGTKMISKGIDVRGVGLMVVVDVDGMLSIPDYSARLRTFQLLVQTVGRAGREGEGSAIIQHYGMDEVLLKYILENDLGGFYEDELERRKLFSYPPYTDIIHVLYSANSKEFAKEMVENVAGKLTIGEILGPSEYLLPRIKGKYSYHFLVKTDNVKGSLEEISYNINRLERRGWKVYVNPPGIYVV